MFGGLESLSTKRDLEVRICPRPDEGNSRHPIFVVDRFSCLFVLFRWQDASGCRELRSCNLSPDGAGRYFHLGIVANAFRLAHVTTSHHIKLAAIFSEPDGSRNAHTGFAERGQRNVFLACNGRRGLACHAFIVGVFGRKVVNMVSTFAKAARAGETAATKVVAAGRPRAAVPTCGSPPHGICSFIRDEAELKWAAVLPDDLADIVHTVRCARRSEILSLCWHRWSSADPVLRKESCARPVSARLLQSP
jgi:hypothetical protein